MDARKEIEFSLIPEDFVALGEYHSGQQPRWKISLYLGLIILLIVAVVIRVMEFAKEFGEVIALIALVVAFSGGLVWYVNRHRLAARAVRKELSKGKNSKLLETRKLAISPDGISDYSSDSAGITVWSGIEKIAVTKNHAFFYVNTASAMILPRRAFSNDLEFTNFIETAQHYFDAANKKETLTT